MIKNHHYHHPSTSRTPCESWEEFAPWYFIKWLYRYNSSGRSDVCHTVRKLNWDWSYIHKVILHSSDRSDVRHTVWKLNWDWGRLHGMYTTKSSSNISVINSQQQRCHTGTRSDLRPALWDPIVWGPQRAQRESYCLALDGSLIQQP